MTETSSFFEAYNISGNPFASTNAENEDLLSEYFVAPPYFESVVGLAETPKSTIVFAPRGSGKTAQRKMIENRAALPDSNFACISYTDFTGITPDTASLAQHKLAICRLMTIAALGHIEAQPERAEGLSKHEKLVLTTASQQLLGGLSQSEFQTALGSVKSLGQKWSDIWNRYGGIMAVVVNAAMKKLGMDDVNIDAPAGSEGARGVIDGQYLYSQLASLFTTLGFSAVYVLVDKVDETVFTNNDKSATFNLISALLFDLPTLEQPGVAYKFFLGDYLKVAFLDGGGRDDRILVTNLHWTTDELSTMLSRRLMAYSENQVDSFNAFLDKNVEVDLHELICRLNPESPRDLIRMCDRIITEHTRRAGYPVTIGRFSMLAGIHEFSANWCDSRFSSIMSEIRRVPLTSFTNRELANNTFRIDDTSMRNKIAKWVDAGAVSIVAQQPGVRPGRPSNVYAFADPRLVIAKEARGRLADSLSTGVFVCRECNEIVIASDEAVKCLSCGSDFNSWHSLWDSVTPGA